METVYDLVSKKQFLDYKTFLYEFVVLAYLEFMVGGEPGKHCTSC